jgi:hypothetical protein
MLLVWRALVLVVVSTCSRPPSRVGEACDCKANLYDCRDFRTHEEAQLCFQYCAVVKLHDVHRLDRDNDGVACECNPWIKERCVRRW